MRVPATVQHASEEALGLYALGDLPESQGLRITAHLAECSRCEEKLRQTEKLIARLRLLREHSSGAWMDLADG
jgi:anti-sigma factor RsiW